ncbi:MAG TPA: hypothetical protein PLE16_02885 [Spirochaetota bacterium]|nr:hypothetical protein [Spirochaetota bacterium]
MKIFLTFISVLSFSMCSIRNNDRIIKQYTIVNNQYKFSSPLKLNLEAENIETRIVYRYGPRKNPFTEEIIYSNGIIIVGTYGEKVHSIISGTVILKDQRNLTIKNNNLIVEYKYLTLINEIKIGDKINIKDLIGYITNQSSIGRTFSIYIKFENEYLDPEFFLRYAE